MQQHYITDSESVCSPPTPPPPTLRLSSFSLFFFVAHCLSSTPLLSLSLTFSLSFTCSHVPSLPLCHSLSHSLSPSLSLSLPFSPSLSISLSLSLRDDACSLQGDQCRGVYFQRSNTDRVSTEHGHFIEAI